LAVWFRRRRYQVSEEKCLRLSDQRESRTDNEHRRPNSSIFR